jgi:hypothetical protein
MVERRVFIDTNIAIECFRISAWRELTHAFTVETVEMVVTEALTGDTSKPGRVNVDRASLINGLAKPPYVVTKKELNPLLKLYPSMVTLDDGEKYLYAHLNAHELPLPPLIVIGTADKGAIVAAHLPRWLDQLISLEHLLNECAPGKVGLLGEQFTETFLSEVRTKALLGIIP